MPVAQRTPLRAGGPSGEGGFTMIITIMVMFVASLLMVAAFTAAEGDVTPSRIDLHQKQAYYAAIAGVQEYEYKLQANPDFWETCPEPKGAVPGEANESFEVSTLPASTDKEATPKCNPLAPFESIIESSGPLVNTFRIKSVGKSGTETRTLIANFKVAGFLDYIYFTQYEVQDPSARGGSEEEIVKCSNYRAQREALGVSGKCGTIVFGPEDKENGPLHTDDTAEVCGGAEFGRPKHEPPDSIEMNGGFANAECGAGGAIFNTATGKPTTTGPELVAPESDGSLKFYVERKPQSYELTGRTELFLEGATEEIKVTNAAGKSEKIKWPKNGLIYVNSGEGGCAYTNFEQSSTDTATTKKEEENCGSVYVSGTYSKPLTVAAAVDVIINGNITPTGVVPPAAAPGTATLGLIATRFIRIYHPCSGGANGLGSLENPWIYAAILSTSHSFLVDNFDCGKPLGKLHIQGAIGQKFRGIVGLVGTSGYDKEYNYDERLATDEPPYFLAPLKAGWKIERLTAETKG